MILEDLQDKSEKVEKVEKLKQLKKYRLSQMYNIRILQRASEHGYKAISSRRCSSIYIIQNDHGHQFKQICGLVVKYSMNFTDFQLFLLNLFQLFQLFSTFLICSPHGYYTFMETNKTAICFDHSLYSIYD